MGSSEIVKKPDPRHSRRQDALKLGLIAVAYVLAHQISFWFPDTAKVLMAIWPAGGIGLAAPLLFPRRLWPAILITLFASGYSADLLAGRPALSSLGFMIANILESLACAWCLTRWGGDNLRFARTREISALFFAATVLNAGTACLGAGAAELTHAATFFDFWLVVVDRGRLGHPSGGFRLITPGTPDHVLVQDRNLRYTFVLNPQLGLTEKDMLGKTDHDLLTRADADNLAVIKKQVLASGHPVHVELPLVDKDGSTAADLRPVLHDQGTRQGSRTIHLPLNHEATRRGHHRGIDAWQGQHVPPVSAGRARVGRRCRRGKSEDKPSRRRQGDGDGR
jgi:hypothetical protein